MDSKWKILWLYCFLVTGVIGKIVPPRKKVCIIGAGPAGLTSVKQLSTWPEEFEPIAFEKSSDVGGQWLYTDSTDVDEHGIPVHSSVYKYLRISGPKQLIAFPDYEEFHGENRSYVLHATVLEYMKNYTQHFDLLRYINLNTLVEKVIAIDDTKWLVKTRNLNTGQHDETICDAVMVCTGNFHEPNIPKIPGIENFSGRVLHSHTYRRPEEFTNQTVIILGASFSGTDIGFEISSYAKKVYLSHRHDKLKTELPPNMIQVPGVVAANGSGFILSDGSRISADSFVYCTGYLYDYPFLDASTGVSVTKGKYVHPLYKHFVHVERPTMAIIGLPYPGFPSPIAYVQAYYFASVLRGKVKLPSRVEMQKDAELPPGTPVSKAHYMADTTLDYYDELAEKSGALPLPRFIRLAYWRWEDELANNLLHYKDYDWIFHTDGRIDIVPHKE